MTGSGAEKHVLGGGCIGGGLSGGGGPGSGLGGGVGGGGTLGGSRAARGNDIIGSGGGHLLGGGKDAMAAVTGDEKDPDIIPAKFSKPQHQLGITLLHQHK